MVCAVIRRRALLDGTATHSDPLRDREVPPAAIANYINADLVLMDLNAGCSPPEGSSLSMEAPLRCSEMPRVLSTLSTSSLLQNRYQDANLGLFLDLDPRRAVGELRDFFARVSPVLSAGARSRQCSEVG